MNGQILYRIQIWNQDLIEEDKTQKVTLIFNRLALGKFQKKVMIGK